MTNSQIKKVSKFVYIFSFILGIFVTTYIQFFEYLEYLPKFPLIALLFGFVSSIVLFFSFIVLSRIYNFLVYGKFVVEEKV